MRTRISVCYPIVVAAAIALLPGCTVSDSHIAAQATGPTNAIDATYVLPKTLHLDGLPRQGSSFMRHVLPSVPLAYVSDAAGGFVDVFNKTTGTLTGTITGFSSPHGLYVDSGRNLWVTDWGTTQIAPQIFVYPPGSTTPSKVLQDPYGPPIDVTVCPGGTAYVSNYYEFNGIGGSVRVYPPGNTFPTTVFQRPGELFGSFLSCNPAGHLFAAYTTNTPTVHARVFEYTNPPAAAGLPVALLTNPSVPGGVPGGVKPITTGPNAGDVMLCDQAAHTVTEYRKTAGVWGPTANVIQSGNQSTPGSGADDWIDIAVGSPAAGFASTRLLAADATALNGSSWQLGGPHAFVQGYADPLFASPFGVAFSPPQSGLGP